MFIFLRPRSPAPPASDFVWHRWVRALLALAWLAFSIVAAWQEARTWWGALLLAAGMVLIGYGVWLLLRLVGGLLWRVLVEPFEWLLNRASSLHGTARWQRGREIARGNLVRDGTVYLGRYRSPAGSVRALTSLGNEHVLVVGPSRSGKNGNVVSTLLAWPASVIAYDEKAELHAITGGFRSTVGKVLRFEPADPESSARYNPLDAVRTGTEFEVADAQNIAEVLAADEVPHQGDGLHWRELGKELLAGVILHVLHRQPGAALGDVVTALSNPKQPVDELFKEMAASDGLASGVGQAQLDRPDRERASVTSSALRYLRLFRDPIVARNTASSSFALADLADGAVPLSLYIVTRGADAVRLKPLVRLLYTVAVTHLLSPPLTFGADGRAKLPHKHKVLLCLDEFSSLGSMHYVEQSLSRCLAYGVSALIVTQDISQLLRAYGEHQGVSVNCNIRVIYPPNEHATALWASNQLGTGTMSTRMRQRSAGSSGRMSPSSTSLSSSTSTHVAYSPRALMLADEIMAMPKLQTRPDGTVVPGRCLILEAGRRGIQAEQFLYWEDPEMVRRMGAAPSTRAQEATSVPYPPTPPQWLPVAARVAAAAVVVLVMGAATWRIGPIADRQFAADEHPVPGPVKHAGGGIDDQFDLPPQMSKPATSNGILDRVFAPSAEDDSEYRRTMRQVCAAAGRAAPGACKPFLGGEPR